jgi:hypothetical protein
VLKGLWGKRSGGGVRRSSKAKGVVFFSSLSCDFSSRRSLECWVGVGRAMESMGRMWDLGRSRNVGLDGGWGTAGSKPWMGW